MSSPRSSSTASITKALTPLEKHVQRFCNEDYSYSPTTVGNGLAKIHGSHATAKGIAIAGFNATHSSSGYCPHFSGQLLADEQGSFGKHLHLGTMRIWDKNGNIDEARWTQFVNFIKENQTVSADKVLHKTLKAYLHHCAKHDPQENDTGRNTNAWGSSESIQDFAATAAWDEVFDRLTEGWEGDDPYITLDRIRLFFDNSTPAFQPAEDKQLPIAKETTPAARPTSP